MSSTTSLAPTGASHAQSSAASVRLPASQRVSHYDLALVPDLTTFTFQGHVVIDLTLTQSTKEIVLHTADCTFENVKETSKPKTVIRNKSEQTFACESLTIDTKAQTVTFQFADILTEGEYKLDIHYDGVLNDQLAGFYRSSYKAADGSTKYMACTQFEATDCRRAVPCIDEPAAKATWDVTLFVSSHLTAVSNMPILERITVKSSKEEGEEVARGMKFETGLVKYTYYTSPIMSTYLLAFVIGEFDYISSVSASGTEVRVYTGLGKTALGRFSLDTATKALDFYNQYFGIHYPLPKMDLLAIPDFAAGAMENWGCITYRETALLIDANNSSAAAMQRVARTVCHEIAHMWFGNLVTMEWWTFLWLNEGFARFMEHLAVDAIYPEWAIWESFVADVYAQALGLDSLESSHPVEVTVNHPDEVNEIFDTISYAKGASLIRMLHGAIGEEAFRTGLQSYLKKFSYKNTLSSDLWSAFSESSGTDVAKMMNEWCTKIGYPVVQVSSPAPQRLCFCQERFLATYDAKDHEKLQSTLWTIPIKVAAWNKANPNDPEGPHMMRVLFDVQKGDYPSLGYTDDCVIKVNPGQTGFYRTQYSDEIFHKIVPSIPILPQIERLGLLRDTYALGASGRISIQDFLSMLQYYENDTNYAVVSALASNLSMFASLHADQSYYPSIQALVRKVFRAGFERLGWESTSTGSTRSDTLQSIFRATILGMMVSVGEDPTCIQTGLAKFRAFAQDPTKPENNIPADLRALIYNLAAKKGDEKDLEALYKMYRESELQEEKNRILSVVGAVDPTSSDASTRIDRALKFLLSDEVRPGNISFAMSGIGSSKLGRSRAWSWFQASFPEIKERFCKGQNFIIAGLLSSMLAGWSSTDILTQTDAFFQQNPIPQAARTLSQLRESITTKSVRLEREREAVAAWLAKNQA